MNLRKLPLAALAASLAAGCAAPSPYDSHQNLEQLLESHERLLKVSDALGESCVEWSKGSADDVQRGAKLYSRTRDRQGLLDGEMAELIEREPQLRLDVERVCGKAFATEYLKRIRTGFRAPHEFEPTSNTIEREPVNTYIRKDPVDTDIPTEDLRPKAKKKDPWE